MSKITPYTWKKVILGWFVYFIISGGVHYFLSGIEWFQSERSVTRSVIFGIFVGFLGSGIYIYQYRRKK